jgi:hypothetical protein
VFIESIYDESPDLSWLTQDYNEPSIPPEEAAKYRAQDAERLDAYERGDWHMRGIRLAAEITLTRPGRVDEVFHLSTPGIWGVESDSGDDYPREIAGDEDEYLRDDLLAVGFTPDDIDAALCDISALEVIDRG